MEHVAFMKTDDVPHFTTLGLQAQSVVKRLTKHREREHRERSQQGAEECDAEKQESSDREHVANDLHHIPPF